MSRDLGQLTTNHLNELLEDRAFMLLMPPPSGVVRPASTADVQVIVRLAGQHGMSLWPTGQYRTECRVRIV
jgi:FAD/FMN-containing dehydrogenase